MLKQKNLDNRTYEERLREAMLEIPLYTNDWTNFNASDPGVTILENLTVFQTLHFDKINTISDEVRLGLLKLAGFETKKGKTARVMLKSLDDNELILPANKKFQIGDMVFETDRLTKVYPYNIIGVYGKCQGDYENFSYVLHKELGLNAKIFGDNPAVGNEVIFITDGMPDPGEEMFIYIGCMDRYNRNPFKEKGNNIFASLEWQMYTENGFEKLNVKDDTACFLLDGYVRIRLPKSNPAVCREYPKEGYCIRAIIKEAAYDTPPVLTEVNGFMIEVFQKETLSSATTYQNPNNVKLFNDMVENGYMRVFAKEKKGSSYYLYNMALSGEYYGRYFNLIEAGPGMYDISFDKAAYGFEPERVKNSVKVLVYSEELMRMYSIGQINGYDNEQFRLPISNIVYTSFSIMTRRLDENNEYIYDFVRPERYEDNALTYHLYETEGRIVIEDAGDYLGAELFIATATVHRGPEGNIRSGSRMLCDEGSFISVGKGTGGCFRETVSELHKRFLNDVKRPYVAVTEKDYETLVKEIPELCISKVNAYSDNEKNLVRVAVMPGTDEKFPTLSKLYKSQIAAYLDERRLLTTRVEIVQPVYVPVNVYGTIYTKKHFGDCKDMIKDVIRNHIDYIHNSKEMGQTLRFNEVFRSIEELNCVEHVYDLTIRPASAGAQARVKDSDVYINENIILYPGEIVIETLAYKE